MSPVRTTRDYRCGDCGAQPGQPCIGKRPGVYHRDRERRFTRSVNLQIARDALREP